MQTKNPDLTMPTDNIYVGSGVKSDNSINGEVLDEFVDHFEDKFKIIHNSNDLEVNRYSKVGAMR